MPAARRLALPLLFLALCTRPAAAADYALLPIGSAPIPTGLYDVKAADLDGDGHVEAVAAVADAGVIEVIKSNIDHTQGTGYMGPIVSYPMGNTAALVLADLNGDGKLDVVTADWNESRATVRLNNGDGTFGTPNFLPMGTHVRDVVAADLDGDGVPDLATGNEAGQLMIRKGVGGGAFGGPQTIAAGGMLKGIDAGDLNHDGKVDLVLIDSQNKRLLPYYNQGGLTFALGTFRTFTGPPSDVKLADLDGDGWLDAAVSREDGLVSVLHDVAGDLQPPASFAIGNLAQSVDVADFDLDGKPDLLVSNYTESSISVLPGLGAMQFGAALSVPTAGNNPRSACAADWDGDGRPDILAGNFMSGSVVYMRNAKDPRIDYRYNALDFGNDFQGLAEDIALQLGNIGGAALTFSASIDNPQFAIVEGGGPYTFGPLGGQQFTIRYLRSGVSVDDGVLTLTSNDPIQPVVQIALHGASSSPPVAIFSAPAPVTVSAGGQASGIVRVKNAGLSALKVTIPSGFRDLAETSALDVGPTSSEFLRTDAAGATWDVGFDGAIGEGTGDAYKGGMRLTGFPVQSGGFLGVGTRELRLGPVVQGGLEITRKVYTSPTLGYVRWVDVAENPTDQAKTWSYELVDNLGFAQIVPIQTSSGDAAFTPADDWIVVPPDDQPGRRAVGRVLRTANGPALPTFASITQTPLPNTITRTRFSFDVPPHGRAAIAEWGIQGVDAADAAAKAAALRASPAAAYEHMDAIDRMWLVNADLASPVFSVYGITLGTHSVPPGDSLDVPVNFDAGLATHASQITGILRLTTDDPSHPSFDAPLSLEVTGGSTVGIDPVPVPGVATLALSGFLPNPARVADRVRIAYRLADARPATLALYDVRGRLLARRALEHAAPGPGSLTLDGALRPGVVWLRLEQGGHAVTTKGIVLP